MLEQSLIENQSRELKTSQDNIVREAYEMLILQAISENNISRNLIFKGGTALRLAYNSPRFSEDLDFSMLEEIPLQDFKDLIENFCSKYKEIELSDLSNKRYTFFALLKIKEDFLFQRFSIKIEISKRKFSAYEKPGFELLPLKSPILPINVLLNVISLETILENKLKAVKERIKSRDLFDIWFVSKLLKKPVDLEIKGFSKTLIRQELNRYLPKNYYYVTEYLIKTYANNRNSKKT